MNPTASVTVGMHGTDTVVVREELTVRHHVPSMPAVYGTPMMIYLMEMASANAIHPHLPDGWVSVGAEVNIRHLAATPIGRTVTATGTVTAINERLVMFRVEAHDGVRLIGEGTHVRGVINLAKFEERLAREPR
ncbi:MAG: thioesterase [Panacagrimonas sp.]|jgi:predicted thioesterase|nr:thioesterase family protein [Panacagrimonas sp.]MCC2658896.1 thioesterase [Panacagrimonas sp.]